MANASKYARVQENLRAYIHASAAVGSRIPSTVKLAKQLEVSVGTINRAIRDLVEDGTLERHRGRGTFVAQNNRNIGFLWPSDEWRGSPYPSAVLHAIEREAHAQDKHVLVRSLRDASRPEFIGPDRARVGGILIQFPSDTRAMTAYHKELIPVVFVDPLIRANGVPFVTADHFSAARVATAYLAGLGHRRIAHVTVDQQFSTIPMAERIHGYEHAMFEAGLADHSQLVRVVYQDASYTDLADPTGHNAAQEKRLLSAITAGGITACVCYDDLYAFWVIRTCHDYGLRVPDDVSIVGINDTPMAAQMWPPLTTVHIPYEEIGQCAVRMLDRLVQEHELLGNGEIIPVRLVERASAKAPGAALFKPMPKALAGALS